MPAPTPVEQHLVKLAEELELSPPGPKDKSGTLHLALGSEMKISVKELDEGFSLFAQIAPLPAQKREELLMLLMRANFLGQGTGGAAIGLDREEKFLTLSLGIPYEMNYRAFRETIEDFANFVDYWRTEILKMKEMMNDER